MNRNEKVAHEIKKVVSQILQEEIRDPRLGFTTIARVDLTPDLRFARIYFSVYGPPAQWDDTMKALEHANGFIRRALGQALKLRFVPEIIFKADHSSEYSIMIEQQLEEIRRQDEDAHKPRKRKRDTKTPRRSIKRKKA